MKQFVKGLDPYSVAFDYLQELFPKLSDAKVETGIFVRPQIKKLVKSNDVTECFNVREKGAWESPKAVADDFLGNNSADNDKELIETMSQSFKLTDCIMSNKFDTLHFHLDVLTRT